jgi:hypothetical protein
VRLEERPDGALEAAAHFGVEEGVPPQWIDRLIEDSQGNLWGSTEGLGIFRGAPTGFQAYYESDGLGSARISSIFEDLAGDLCVTTSVENFARPPSHLKVKRGDVFERVELQPASGFTAWGWGWNQFGLQAHDAEWWFPSEDGLYRYAAANEPRNLSARPPLRVYRGDRDGGTDGVFRVFADSHGNIWFTSVSHHQLIRLERVSGQFHRFSTAEGWPVDGIATLIRESAEGYLWIGTFNEILRFRGADWRTSTQAGAENSRWFETCISTVRVAFGWPRPIPACTVVTTPARRPPGLFVIPPARGPFLGIGSFANRRQGRLHLRRHRKGSGSHRPTRASGRRQRPALYGRRRLA